MNEVAGLRPDDRWIRSLRSKKNKLDPAKPAGWFLEYERSRSGSADLTATVFFTNRECPFSCLMCDLWKNTTDYTVKKDHLLAQLESVRDEIQSARHLKLYNSGNFFDSKAIPEDAYESIANWAEPFKTLIVECHPKLIDEKCLHFRDLIKPELQVAIGLETANADMLSRLNKKMNLNDFRKSVRYLNDHSISVRAFILLNLPWMSREENILWAKRSIDFSFDCGAECCVVIPTRTGNGAMDWLNGKGYFNEPGIESLEEVAEYGVKLGEGRVFADLWDLHKFSRCEKCYESRKERLNQLNLTQVIGEKISCNCLI